MKRSTTNQLGAKFSRALIIPVIAVVGLSALLNPSLVSADTYDQQIRQLQGEISGYQSESARLRGEADTLQNAVNALNAQKQAIQAQIDLSQAKLDKLKADIEVNERKLERQRKTINKTVAQIYANGSTTPIEMVASSKNVGEYVSSQAVRGSVQTQLKQAMDQVKKIKAELVQQKTDVERVISDQTAQRNDLAAKEAEQANLLAQTQGQEAAYQSMIGQRQSALNDIYAKQQQSLIKAGGHATAGDPNKGGYPSYLANAPKDSVVDDWGMYNRECVSYTAWKVEQKTGYMPYWGGQGNANQWPGSADRANIPRGSTPRVGSVGIAYSVYSGDVYGHAVWVEQVVGSDVIVSQYNWGSPGSYSEMRVSASFFDTYIYF